MSLHSNELEQAVIGKVILRGFLSHRERTLSTADFYHRPYMQIWSKIVEIDEENQKIEIGDVYARCRSSYPAFSLSLSDLSRFVVEITPFDDSSNEVKHIRNLSNCRRLRSMLRSQMEGLEESVDFESALLESERALQSIRATACVSDLDIAKMENVLEDEVFPRIDRIARGELVKVPFGFKELDYATNGGAAVGELVVLGAKPKSGKSALVLQVASYQASIGIPSLLVSREMLNVENGFRFLSQRSRFTNNVFSQTISKDIFDELKVVGRSCKNLPLYLDDRSRTVADVRRRVMMSRNEILLRSVFVDYAQLMRPDVKRQTRAEDLEAVFYDLKDLAQEFELVVYVNAQFNRQGIRSHRPTMADFDGSSAAEKAGNLILIWDLEHKHDSLVDGRNGKFWIEAGRSVGIDSFEVVFQGHKSLFHLS